MSASLWIDVITIALGLVFLLIGFARGVLPELFSLLGIMVGIVFVGRWGDAWTPDVQNVFHSDQLNSQLYTYYGIFLLCFLLIGFIAPLALVRFRSPLSSGQRLMGGLLGLFNASLVVTWLLGYLTAISNEGTSAVASSTIGSWLVKYWVNWSLLALIGLVVLLIIFGAASRSFRILTGPEVQQMVQTTTTVTARPPVSPYPISPQQSSYAPPPSGAPTRMNQVPPAYPPPYPPPYQPSPQPWQPPAPTYPPPAPRYTAADYPPPPPSRYSTPAGGVNQPVNNRVPGYTPPPAYEPPRPLPPVYEAQPRPLPPPIAPAYPMPEQFAPSSAPEQVTRVDGSEVLPRSPLADEASSLLERRSQSSTPLEQSTAVDLATLPPMLPPTSYPHGPNVERETHTVESVSDPYGGQRETNTFESVSDTPTGQQRTVEQETSVTPPQSAHYEMGDDAERRIVPPPDRQT